jgi:hypothetical protein
LPLVPPQQGLRPAPSCSQQPAPAVRLLSWRGLGCGFSQLAPPPSPSCLRPLGLWGRKAESPASTRNFFVSIHTIASPELDYSTQRVYLLRRSLSDLQLLGVALACHVARPPRRRRQTSFQTSRRIADEGTLGSPGRPNLDRSWNRSWSVSSSSSSDVSSMMTVSSPSPTLWHSLALPFPSSGISTSQGGEAGSETNFTMSSYDKNIG